MIAAIGAGLFAIAFALLAAWAGVVQKAQTAVQMSLSVGALLRDPLLDDAIKEREMQRLSLRLFGLFGEIVLRLAIAAAAPVAVLLVLDRMNLLSLESVETASMSWPLIALYIAATLVAMLLRRRR